MGGSKLTNGETGPKGLSGLQSDKSIQRLEQISSLRARGISKKIDLPQLVVCGDQSAGKSSVLEGISSIPFPRADGVCTKFPTEVILEHSADQESITATIIPHSSRSDGMKTKLQSFCRSIDDYSELPEVIGAAGELMGLAGYGANEGGPAFVEDVLRIKVVGRTGLHLSIVDLPGLIANPSEEQTQADVDTVQRMVDSYIEKPRTIILAIVQASNDIANQSIIRKSKDFDRAGQRTVGVITKPDLINEGTEGRIALLANNQDTTKLQLGYFILKNPTPAEMKASISMEQRSANEVHFFQSSRWIAHGLDVNRIGIDKLRQYLQILLDQHVEKELPKVREEIRAMIKATDRQLCGLPTERPSPGHLRMFLSDLATQYYRLSAAALNGDYHTTNVDFFSTEGQNVEVARLRALIHRLNAKFADTMRDRGQSVKQGKTQVAPKLKSLGPYGEKGQFQGHKKKKRGVFFAEPYPEPEPMPVSEPEPESEPVPPWDFMDIPPVEFGRPTFASDQDEPQPAQRQHTGDGQRLFTKAEMRAWVKETYLKTRGKELPGNYNHVLLTELYHHQSRRWPHLAENHLETVFDNVTAFVRHAVTHLQAEDYVRAEIHEGMSAKLQVSKAEAEEELHRLCKDEQQQPITYNHYFTDNVQKSRTSHTRSMLEQALDDMASDESSGYMNVNKATLLSMLEKHVTVDMDEQACSEALDGLDAYYKASARFANLRKALADSIQVALKTFVDNMCRQVIERHLLRNLPDLFAARDVAWFSDEELQRIAGERQDVVVKRKMLQEQLEMLKAGLNDLRK